MFVTITVIVDITGIAIGIVVVVLLAVFTVTENGTATDTIADIVHGKNAVTANVLYGYCCCYPFV